MKLTDFLQDVGRPIAYYPKLRRITGSTNATIFLCQLIYWKGKEADPEGWIYKTAEEMEAETGLSYDEQKTARTKLKDAGLIEEHYARLDHQMKYRLNVEAIDTAWGQPVPESRNAMFGNEASPFSLNSNTENTTENSVLKTDEEQPTYGHTAYNRGEQERPDKLALALQMTNFPGAKKAARVDSLLSAFGVAFVVNTETKDWREFAKYAINMQDEHGWEPQKFIEWVKKQQGYPDYWSRKRMQENYPKAFAEIPQSPHPVFTPPAEPEKKYIPAPPRKRHE